MGTGTLTEATAKWPAPLCPTQCDPAGWCTAYCLISTLPRRRYTTPKTTIILNFDGAFGCSNECRLQTSKDELV